MLSVLLLSAFKYSHDFAIPYLIGEQGAIRPPVVSKDESRDDGSGGGGRAHRPVGEFAGGTAAGAVPESVAEEKAETAAYEEVEDGGGRRGHSSGDDGVSDATAAASCADRRG
nr:uncharacterized protein LOC109191620 [Ipomoea batatas]